MDELERKVAARIGDAVRTCRKKVGWSQAVLAEQVDTSIEYVSLLERGERLPSVGTLMRLAHLFGVKPGALLGDEAPTPERDPAQALLRVIPEPARPAVLGMLRGVIEAYRRKGGKRR